MIANSQVHAVRIDLEPGESTAMSQHDRDFVIVSIGDSDFEFIGPVNTVPMSMHDSEVEVLKGHWPHRVHNRSQHALHLVEIEVARGIAPERAVCGLNAPSCRESRFAYNDHDRYTAGTLFETPTIKLAKVENRSLIRDARTWSSWRSRHDCTHRRILNQCGSRRCF
jgi:hypothetical protein